MSFLPGRHVDDFTHREDFSDEFLDYNPSRRTPELEKTQPRKSIEVEPTPEREPERMKFNWIAFIVMLVLIGVALTVGILVPGILDEYIAIIIINLIYGFAQKHGFKTPKK